MHALFWGSFGVTRRLSQARGTDAAEPAPAPAPVAGREAEAPYSRVLLILHSIAFGVMYFGIGKAVFGHAVPEWFRGQRIVGTLVMLAGAALANWALLFFRSWRFRAKLDASHELATGGPFRLMRHPIYTGLDLLALGSAIWIPSTALGIGTLLMVVGSDLRARAEEKVLREVFGQAYRDYARRTRRFIPGVY